MSRSISSIDWTLVFIYFLIALFGIINIYSVNAHSGKMQLVWLTVAVFVGIIIFMIRPYILENFAPIIYGFGITMLVGVLIFGSIKNGAKAWFDFGFISFQPVEAMKIGVALMLATYCSSTNFNLNYLPSLIKTLAIIIAPIFLIILQPDVGSILVFTAFFIAIVREGFNGIIFLIGIYFAGIFLFSINFNTTPMIIGFSLVFLILLWVYYNFFRTRSFAGGDFFTIKNILIVFGIYLLSISLIVASPHIFQKLPKHQKERIMVLFEGEIKYAKTSGYNLLYSKSAIANGGWLGQGFKQGPVTIGNFVPEQRTDYIFCTVGEEWGFLGAGALVILYAVFIGRIYFLSERMKSSFSRVFGYCVASILLIHFTINIAMVLGLFPTVGIPLPFFSYGGSSLLAFSVLIGIFVKLVFEDNQSLI